MLRFCRLLLLRTAARESRELSYREAACSSCCFCFCCSGCRSAVASEVRSRGRHIDCGRIVLPAGDSTGLSSVSSPRYVIARAIRARASERSRPQFQSSQNAYMYMHAAMSLGAVLLSRDVYMGFLLLKSF